MQAFGNTRFVIHYTEMRFTLQREEASRKSTARGLGSCAFWQGPRSMTHPYALEDWCPIDVHIIPPHCTYHGGASILRRPGCADRNSCRPNCRFRSSIPVILISSFYKIFLARFMLHMTSINSGFQPEFRPTSHLTRQGCCSRNVCLV